MVPRSETCYESDDDVDKKPVIFKNAPLFTSSLGSCQNISVQYSATETASTSEQSPVNSTNKSPVEQTYEVSATIRSTCQPSSSAASDRSVPEENPENAEPSSAMAARKVTYAKWSKEEQRLLVQMWCDHMKTSRMEKPNWKLMASRLSVKRKITSTQCQRKIKYLRDLYREAKAYNEKNKNQPWEDRETSPYYHEIDAVLTCHGSPHFSHVEEASGITAASASNEFVAAPDVSAVPMFTPPRISVGSQDAATSFSSQQRLAYRNTINCPVNMEDDHGALVEPAPNSSSSEIRAHRKRRKKNQDKRDDNENDSSVFRETMEQFLAQGDRITAVMEASMLKAQNQQFEMMTTFMNAFLQQSQGQNWTRR